MLNKLFLIVICVSSKIFAHQYHTEFRLPNTTIPIRYEISLEIIPDRHFHEFYNGVVKIQLKAVQNTSSIVMHASYKITELSVLKLTNLGDGIEIVTAPPVRDRQIDLIEIVTINQMLIKNQEYILEMKFKSQYNQGYHSSTVLVEDGDHEFEYQVYTHMEPIYARDAFPCYDEPKHRAIFSIQIKHAIKYKALSNMPVIKTQEIPVGYSITTFKDSPPMPTYLVSYCVGDYSSISNFNETLQPDRLPISIYAQHKHIHDMYTALNFSNRILNELEDYLGVRYSLPKLDQIELKTSSGMEDWGIINYRLYTLLLDNTSDSINSKWYPKLKTISHELAHQFFGNLVTFEWWDSLWLAEGLSQYLGFLINERTFPESQYMHIFVASNMKSSLRRDTSTPMNGETMSMSPTVNSSSSIQNLFNYVAYDKAGCIVRMLHHTLGNKAFRNGLRNYLIGRSFGTANSQIFFDYMNSAAQTYNVTNILATNVTVGELFKPWVTQTGHPILNVNVNRTNGVLELEQEEFDGVDSTRKSKWWIPINYLTKTKSQLLNGKNLKPHFWISPNENIKRVPINLGLNRSDWVILNKQSTGYFRINYDHETWHLIIEELVNGDINRFHPYNRAQLIDDCFYFVQNEKLQIEILLDLLIYLRRENEYVVWKQVAQVLPFFREYYNQDASLEASIQKLLIHISEPVYLNHGLAVRDGDSVQTNFLREFMIDFACRVGVKQCRDDVVALVKLEMQNLTTALSFRSKIYSAAVKYAPDEIGSYLFEKYLVNDNFLLKTSELVFGVVRNEEVFKTIVIAFGDDSRSENLTSDQRVIVNDMIKFFFMITDSMNFFNNALEIVLDGFLSSKYLLWNHIFFHHIEPFISTNQNLEKFRNVSEMYGFLASQNLIQRIEKRIRRRDRTLGSLKLWLIDFLQLYNSNENDLLNDME